MKRCVKLNKFFDRGLPPKRPAPSRPQPTMSTVTFSLLPSGDTITLQQAPPVASFVEAESLLHLRLGQPRTPWVVQSAQIRRRVSENATADSSGDAWVGAIGGSQEQCRLQQKNPQQQRRAAEKTAARNTNSNSLDLTSAESTRVLLD